MIRYINRELHRENEAQWKVLWDLKGAIQTLQEEGLDVDLMRIDFPDQGFYNSFEKKHCGERRIVGFRTTRKDGEIRAVQNGKECHVFPEFLEEQSGKDILMNWKLYSDED